MSTVISMTGLDWLDDISKLKYYFNVVPSTPTSTTHAVSTTGGKYGGSCVTLLGQDQSAGASHLLDAVHLDRTVSPDVRGTVGGSHDITEFTMTFWVKMTTTGSPNLDRYFLNFYRSQTGHCFGLTFDASTQHLGISRSAFSNPGTPIATVLATLDDGFWHHLEVYAKMSSTDGATDGVIQVYVDGSLGINLSATSTSLNAMDTYAFYSMNPAADSNYIDISIDDLVFQTGFHLLGEHRIYNRVPTTDVTTQWTPSTGTSHYNLVNDLPSDSSDYISSNTTDQVDLFEFDDVADSESDVTAVQVSLFGIGGTTYARQRVLMKSAGTLYDYSVTTGSEAGSGNTGIMDHHVFALDPGTSAAWTMSGFNALQAGVKISSGGFANACVIHAILLECLAPGFSGSTLPSDAFNPVVIAVNRGTAVASTFRYVAIK